MKINNSEKLNACRVMAAGLRWDKRNAEASARLLISKANWAGLELAEVEQLLRRVPGASYVRQHQHILSEAFNAVTQAAQPAAPPSDEFELLLSTMSAEPILDENAMTLTLNAVAASVGTLDASARRGRKCHRHGLQFPSSTYAGQPEDRHSPPDQ